MFHKSYQNKKLININVYLRIDSNVIKFLFIKISLKSSYLDSINNYNEHTK